MPCDKCVDPDGVPVMGRALINGMPYSREVIRVAVVTLDGASCTVPLGDLPDMIEDGGQYTVQVKTMPRREFEALPEFAGW